jgi:hypothetical protein
MTSGAKVSGQLTGLMYGTREVGIDPVNLTQGGEAGSKGITEIPVADQIVVVMNPGKPEGAKGLTCSVS